MSHGRGGCLGDPVARALALRQVELGVREQQEHDGRVVLGRGVADQAEADRMGRSKDCAQLTTLADTDFSSLIAGAEPAGHRPAIRASPKSGRNQVNSRATGLPLSDDLSQFRSKSSCGGGRKVHTRIISEPGPELSVAGA
jgi:hypothetical protein